MMELFNPKYVHAMWSSYIEGKQVIVSDNIDVMKENLEKGCNIYTTITRSIGGGIGLHDTEGSDWKYAYYDPNLDVKIAFNEGKRIGYSMNNICPDPPDEVLHKDTPGDKERLFHTLDYMNPKSTVILDVEPYTEGGLKWTDLKLGDKIKKLRGECCGDKGMVTYIDVNTKGSMHILAGSCWISDDELKDWELADD